MVTVAPGTPAPWASVIEPSSVPLTALARDGLGEARIRTAGTAARTTSLATRELMTPLSRDPAPGTPRRPGARDHGNCFLMLVRLDYACREGCQPPSRLQVCHTRAPHCPRPEARDARPPRLPHPRRRRRRRASGHAGPPRRRSRDRPRPAAARPLPSRRRGLLDGNPQAVPHPAGRGLPE